MSGMQAVDERQRALSEQLARCIATMVYYQADGWSWSAAQLLWEEARSLRTWASHSCSEDDLNRFVLAPLKEELTLRYGPTVGSRLQREFARALGDAAQP